MKHNDFAYNTTIMKISSSVINRLNQGKDPFVEIIKEAEKENFTPQFIRTLVQHINNEIFLNHYNKGCKGKLQIIDPEKVIDALNIKKEKDKRSKTASEKDNNNDNNYWSLYNIDKVPVKVALDDNENISDINRINSIKKIEEKNYQNKKRKEKEKLYNEIVKSASLIQEKKVDLYNELLRDVRNDDISIEEVIILEKTAEDDDIKEVLNLVIDRSNKRYNKDDLYKLANEIDSYNINKNSIVVQKIEDIIDEKKNIISLIKKYKTYE